jgi:hypothetical protein
MKTMKAILSVLFVLMLFFAGCSSPPANEQTTATTNAEGDQGTATTQSGAATTNTQTTATTAAAGNGNTNELLNLFKGAVTDYMVVYNIKTTGGPGDSTNADMTQYIKGENKMRMDSSYVMNGQATETRMYLVDKVFTSCSKMAGDWSCMKLSTPNQKDPAETKKEMEDNIKTSSVTRLADRVVIGINTKCYHAVMSITNADPEVRQRIIDAGMENWEATYCISNDGVALYSEAKSGDMTIVSEAKSYKKGTADSDYVPPAEAKDLSSLTGGDGSQGGLSQEDIQKMIEQAKADAAANAGG